MVRIFRVVRVFRIFRLGKRLKSEVLSRLLTLVFTLLAIIVTAAGIFFELETKFSVSTCVWVCVRSLPQGRRQGSELVGLHSLASWRAHVHSARALGLLTCCRTCLPMCRTSIPT